MANLFAADGLSQTVCRRRFVAECLPRTELVNASGQTSLALGRRRWGLQLLGITVAPLVGDTLQGRFATGFLRGVASVFCESFCH